MQPGRFVSIDELLSEVDQNADRAVPQIPRGQKDNCFTVITDNRIRSERSGASYVDDCGAYDSYVDDCGACDSGRGATVNKYFVIEQQKAKSVYLKGGLCVKENRIRVDGEKPQQWIPLEPQPCADSVVKVHWVYSTPKADNCFKRRVSCITRGTASSGAAVVESVLRSASRKQCSSWQVNSQRSIL